MKRIGLTGWAALAEIVGTIAVIISLLFVVVSLRQNTAAIHASNEDFLRDLNDRYWSDRINNPDVYENWEKMLGGEPISTAAEGQIYDFVLRAMNGWEGVYVKYRSGQLSAEQFDNWHEANTDWLRRRVPRPLWEQMNGPQWRLDFEDLIDEIYESM